MSAIKRTIVSTVVLGLGLVAAAAGCASSGNAASNAAATDHALMCAKCETVWVPEVRGQGTKVTVLTSAAKMTCPTCDAMAKSQLTGDGKVQLHDCPDCKVAPKPVSSGGPRPATRSPEGHALSVAPRAAFGRDTTPNATPRAIRTFGKGWPSPIVLDPLCRLRPSRPLHPLSL